MTPQQHLPFIMMFMSIIAAIIYGIEGDYKHTLYWFSSATIIYSVTF